MSTVNLLLAQNEHFNLVKVAFKNGQRLYTYKSLIPDLEAGDTVIVESPSEGLVTVVVHSVHKLHELALKADIHYKWIVQKVDLTEYERVQSAEAEAQKVINNAQTKKLHEEMRENLKDQLGADTLETVTKLVRL